MLYSIHLNTKDGLIMHEHTKPRQSENSGAPIGGQSKHHDIHCPCLRCRLTQLYGCLIGIAIDAPKEIENRIGEAAAELSEIILKAGS